MISAPGWGQLLVKEENGDSWALVMKLSKNDFCHGSSRWTDGQATNPHFLLDTSFPNHREYDAKHIAFHKLAGVTAIRLQTKFGASEVHFEGSGTPEQLITTNDIKISAAGGFNSKTYWDSWQTTFGDARDRAPAFMRADKFVTDPKPECRTDPWNAPSGCGKPCLFCMQAGDGPGCPVASAWNDISSGIGLSASHCGGGDSGDCSTSGNWAGDSSTLVWAKFSGCTSSMQSGACNGDLHAEECSTVPLADCGKKFVQDGEVFLQCMLVGGNTCSPAGGACLMSDCDLINFA